MAKVVFINAESRNAEVRDVPDNYKEIQHVLGCDCYGIVCRKVEGSRKEFDIYHDDEFLYKPRTCNRTGMCTNYGEQLYENIFVARHDNKGNIKSLTEDEIALIMDNVRAGVLLYKL